MADTIQSVRWAIEMGCSLRTGGAVRDPVEAAEAIGQARYYSDCLRRSSDGFGIYGDVCVTSYSGSGIPFPSGGFAISEAFRNQGGAEGLIAMCGACPANLPGHRAAGCAGWLWPLLSKEADLILRGSLTEHGLVTQHERAFPATSLIWYGLWTRSPVAAEALPVLRVLMEGLRDGLSALASPDSDWEWVDRRFHEFSRFLLAIQSAQQHALPLHVWMAPPGHTDLGVWTTFAHCPVCKGEAPLKRWKRRYPEAEIACQICGARYSPAATARSRKDDWSQPDLRETLGPNRFSEFARSYLIRSAVNPVEAERIVAEKEVEYQQEKAENAAREARELRAQRFIQDVLYVGLHPVRHSDIEGDEGSLHFRAEEFAEVLRRCRLHGVEVTYMLHHSESGKNDRNQFGNLSDPQGTFSKWQRKGCSELFAGGFHVPDALLDRHS